MTLPRPVCASPVNHLVTYILYSFVKRTMPNTDCGTRNGSKITAKIPVISLAALPLGTHDPVNLMVLRCQWYRGAIFGAFEDCTGESQWRPLGLWSKALFSPTHNDFERQLLACYGGFVEPENLLSYHVTRIAYHRHRLGITYQAIWLDMQSSKPTSVGSDIHVTEPRPVRNGVVQTPMVPTTPTMLSVLKYYLVRHAL